MMIINVGFVRILRVVVTHVESLSHHSSGEARKLFNLMTVITEKSTNINYSKMLPVTCGYTLEMGDGKGGKCACLKLLQANTNTEQTQGHVPRQALVD
jgi:hypothetical protein